MKKILLLWLYLMASLVSNSALAADKIFNIRADGLACPFCAYGIEKKFMKIDGVKHVDINLKKGLVIVTADKTLELKDAQLKTLFNDSGFTFRKLVKIEDVADKKAEVK